MLWPSEVSMRPYLKLRFSSLLMNLRMVELEGISLDESRCARCSRMSFIVYHLFEFSLKYEATPAIISVAALFLLCLSGVEHEFYLIITRFASLITAVTRSLLIFKNFEISMGFICFRKYKSRTDCSVFGISLVLIQTNSGTFGSLVHLKWGAFDLFVFVIGFFVNDLM